MLKSLASLLWKKPEETPPAKAAPRRAPRVVADEHTPIYQSLAMTEELREALFPKTPRMMSAIFDRPLTPLTRPLAAQAPPAASGDGYPII